jgi:hypothetical protein
MKITRTRAIEIANENYKRVEDLLAKEVERDALSPAIWEDEEDKKLILGQFFTKKDLWFQPQVEQFIKDANPNIIIDPFAGQGDLLKVIKNIKTVGFDIDESLNWFINDSLISIPKFNNSLILTNPPYLAKNSAQRKKFSINFNDFQDLYQIALAQCLKSSYYVVAIIPETFIRYNLFIEYLDNATILEGELFEDTEYPVCIVCLRRGSNLNGHIYKNDKYIGKLKDLLEIRNRYKSNGAKIIFNDRNGNIALRAIDGHNDRIRFLRVEDLNYDIDKVKVSSRAITLISVKCDDVNEIIEKANQYLNEFRDECCDLLLAPFKGNNKEGKRRRRLDFEMARRILNEALDR